MSHRGEKLYFVRRSPLAGGAIAVALAACLAASGCSGTSAASDVHVVSSTAVTSPAPFTGPPADPFTGSPADRWADGAAGIVLPAAKPAGSFTAAQVELAYQWTRKLLVAANLDKQTLAGGAPTAFANLLTKGERTWFLGGLNKKGADKNGIPLSSRAIVVSFAPGSTQLIGAAIKVHGTMSAKAGTDDGSKVLDIDVDYLFTYAAEPPHQPAEWMRLISEQAWTLEFGSWQGAATAFEPWLTVNAASGMAGNSCGATDGYMHPAWPSTAPQPSDSASGKPLNPYVPGQSVSAGCHNTTGT